MRLLGFDDKATAKLLSRVTPMMAIITQLFLNGVVLGWYKPNLSTPLRFALEIAIPAVVAIFYNYLAGAWWRTRDKTDRDGVHADFVLACILAAHGAALFICLLVIGLDLTTRVGAYAVAMLLIFTPPVLRDLATSLMAKFGIGRMKP